MTTETRVRFEVLLALNGLDDKLTDEQKERVETIARALTRDEGADVRMEAKIRLANAVDQWLEQALQTWREHGMLLDVARLS